MRGLGFRDAGLPGPLYPTLLGVLLCIEDTRHQGRHLPKKGRVY